MNDYIKNLKNKLIKQGVNLNANENIAEHLNAEDKVEIERSIEHHAQGMLDALLIDTDTDENTKDTAKRIAKMYAHEVMKGRLSAKPEIASFPNEKSLDHPYIVGPISVRSICAHHFVPVVGTCVIAVLPGQEVIGLSKFNRLVEWVMARPQMQEDATIQIAKILQAETKAKGLAVVVKADHLCCQWRGVKDQSSMMTWDFQGTIKPDDTIRREMVLMLGDDCPDLMDEDTIK